MSEYRRLVLIIGVCSVIALVVVVIASTTPLGQEILGDTGGVAVAKTLPPSPVPTIDIHKNEKNGTPVNTSDEHSVLIAPLVNNPRNETPPAGGQPHMNASAPANLSANATQFGGKPPGDVSLRNATAMGTPPSGMPPGGNMTAQGSQPPGAPPSGSGPSGTPPPGMPPFGST